MNGPPKNHDHPDVSGEGHTPEPDEAEGATEEMRKHARNTKDVPTTERQEMEQAFLKTPAVKSPG